MKKSNNQHRKDVPLRTGKMFRLEPEANSMRKKQEYKYTVSGTTLILT